jgi:hypothetical protein
VFSVAGSFMTRIRSRLSDTTLDHFSFAKCKFKNDKLKTVVNIPIFQCYGSVRYLLSMDLDPYPTLFLSGLWDARKLNLKAWSFLHMRF